MKKELHMVALRPQALDTCTITLTHFCEQIVLRDKSVLAYIACTAIDLSDPRYLIATATRDGKMTKLYIPHEFISAIFEVESHKRPLGFLRQQESPEQ